MTNIDILIGVTADESVHFAKEHIFNHYIPKKYRSKYASWLPYRSTSKNTSISSSLTATIKEIYSHIQKSQYMKTYLQINYPNYLCFYDEIHERFFPDKSHQHNLTALVRSYTNLVR